MPAYGDRPPADAETMPWSRVLVRMVLVVLPSLLIGSFIGGIMVGVLGAQVLRDTPSLTLLMPAMAGLLAGIGLGVVFAPGRTRLAGHALLALVITLAAYLLIFGLSLLRASGPLPSASAGGLPGRSADRARATERRGCGDLDDQGEPYGLTCPTAGT